jgi:hypothetical protein
MKTRKTIFTVIAQGCGVQFVGHHFGIGHADDADQFASENEAQTAIAKAGAMLEKLQPKIQEKEAQ